MPEGDVLLVGGGRFGRLAWQRLGGRVCCLVEPDPSPDLLKTDPPLVREDGLALVGRLLASGQAPPWIVPCLPRHLLWEWLLGALAGARARLVPGEILPPVATRMRGEQGEHYLSLADFLCPDDCPEPARNCTVTGLPRGEPMYSRLGGIQAPGWRVGVLRSYQLAPGVGGLRSREMLELKQRMEEQGGVWLVGAACRCHGVVHGLEVPGGAGEGGS